MTTPFDTTEFCDDFISYQEQFGTKQNELDTAFSPFSGDTDSTAVYHNNHTQLTGNCSKDESSDIFNSNLDTKQELWNSNKSLDDKSDESFDDFDSSVAGNSKKINKKSGGKKQTDLQVLLASVDKKYIPEGFFDPNLSEENRKKMIKMIRNRAAAQNSRDKKKMYMNELEDVKNKLQSDNQHLMTQNTYLVQELKKYEAMYMGLAHEYEVYKQCTQTCAHCGKAPVIAAQIPKQGDKSQLTRGTQSPKIARGMARGKVFTFVFTILSVILMISVPYTIGGNFGPGIGKTAKPTNFLFEITDALSRGFGFEHQKSVVDQLTQVDHDQEEIITLKSFCEGKEFDNLVSNILPENIKTTLSKNKTLHDQIISPLNFVFIDQNFKMADSAFFCPCGFEYISHNTDKLPKVFSEIERADTTEVLSN